ncbi:MAG: toll/interleukin-1 receptor domain-containing protein [Candidatus Bathyarchaeota archaeon]|nr:MAG: toll/interleukin-1 receptor domain-containing protein [Candidatus Bathyarchaeota archaeon]
MQGSSSNHFESYDLFVSYNKADVEFAKRLVSAVENQQYNGRKLICFFAPWDIEPGENILLKIEKGLTTSRFVCLIMSPDWLKSDWTTLERVVPVHSDPAGIKGRIIPILRRDCSIPPTIRILNWLDFRTDRNFNREIKRLISRIRGISPREIYQQNIETDFTPQPVDSLKPDFQKEILSSNLFPIIELPRIIYRAKAKVRKRSDVWEMLGEGVSIPVFALREESQEIFSFAKLTNPQQKLIKLVNNSETNEVLTAELINSDNSSVLIELLNRSMTEHMKNIGMVYDWKNKKTFYPLEKNGDEMRYSKWTVKNREYPRLVVQKSKSGRYFIHKSCKATFTSLGENIFLKVIPGFHFTIDGLIKAVPNKFMSSLSTRWMNPQKNHSVLDDVRFWIYKISEGTENAQINVGGTSPVLVRSTPLSAVIDRGIVEDYRERLWLQAPVDDDSSEDMLDEENLEDNDNMEDDEY